MINILRNSFFNNSLWCFLLNGDAINELISGAECSPNEAEYRIIINENSRYSLRKSAVKLYLTSQIFRSSRKTGKNYIRGKRLNITEKSQILFS